MGRGVMSWTFRSHFRETLPYMAFERDAPKSARQCFVFEP